ncbi:MAG: hypothetical protein KIT48_07570 [Pseudolabrys sp.]|nr:hypothetical protein [Pseudolabrys sp.]
MSDAALKNAIAKRDEIASQINKLQSQIDELRRLMARTEQFISDWQMFATGADKEDDGGAEDDNSPARNIDKLEVGNYAAEFLEEACKPLKRKELMRRLNEMGIHIYGKNPDMVLSTMMWRMQDRFVRIPGFGYWFRDKPYAPAKYTPGSIPNTLKKEDAEQQEQMEELLE